MGIFAVLAISLVALFAFVPGIRNGHLVDRHWSAKAPDGTEYGPRRKSIVTDVDGNSQRGGDPTQMTRRDRGREYWSFTYDPNNSNTVRNWLMETFHIPKPVSADPLPPASPSYGRTIDTNFEPKKKDPTLTIQPLPLERDEALPPLPPDYIAPAAAVAPVAPHEIPLPKPYPVNASPLYQYQMETAPLPAPVHAPAQASVPSQAHVQSLGRKIQTVLQEDPALSKAVRLTLKVSSGDGKVTVRGLVLNDEAREYVINRTREMAGPGVIVENKLISLTPQPSLEGLEPEKKQPAV